MPSLLSNSIYVINQLLALIQRPVLKGENKLFSLGSEKRFDNTRKRKRLILFLLAGPFTRNNGC